MFHFYGPLSTTRPPLPDGESAAARDYRLAYVARKAKK